PSQNQRRILTPERDAVRHRVLDVELAAAIGDVVEIALGVGLVDVDRGWHDTIAHRQQRRGDAGGAARALRGADQALQGRPRQPVGMTIESELHSARFDAVVQLRRRAVIVDVLHVALADAGLFHRHTDGARGLFAAFFETHAMVSLARRSVARNFAVDVRASCARLLHLFEYEEPCALGDDEAVAIARKRARRALWLVIPTRRHEAHQLKAAQDQGGDRRIDAAGNHGLQHARLNVAERVAERVGGTGAAGGDDVAEAAKSEAHRHLTSERADRAGGNRVYAALLLVAGVIEAVLFFPEVLASAARAHHDADAAPLVTRQPPHVGRRLP